LEAAQRVEAMAKRQKEPKGVTMALERMPSEKTQVEGPEQCLAGERIFLSAMGAEEVLMGGGEGSYSRSWELNGACSGLFCSIVTGQGARRAVRTIQWARFRNKRFG
jgi:hypothetical protein